MKKIILVCLFFVSPLAGAYQPHAGKIAGYIPYVSGGVRYLFIHMDSASADRLSCNSTDRYVITEKALNYQDVFAAVVAAYHAQVSVKIHHLGHCNDYQNSESMSYLCVGKIPC